MRFFFFPLALVLVLQVERANAQQAEAILPQVLNSKSDSVAYAFGLAIGEDLKRTGIESLDAGMLVSAIKAVYAEQGRSISEEQQRQIITSAITEAHEKRNAVAIGAAREFMEVNKTKPGIVTTDSGLQYEVIREGTGNGSPQVSDTVTVHYRGVLADGQQFDSSYDRSEPSTFPLNRVISGWQEGLQLMTEGSHYRFHIPYELGYGERGSGGMIPPFSPLVFDVELISINPASGES